MHLNLIRRLAALAALLLTGAAVAHTGTDAGAHHGFGTGLLHPFAGLDHLVAALAVGLWAGLRAPSDHLRGLAVPLAFVLALAAGAGLPGLGMTLPAIEPMIAVSLLAVGLALAMRGEPATPLPVLAAIAFGLPHGAAHGVALPGAASIAGMLAGMALLLACGLRIGRLAAMRRAAWPRVAGLLTAGLGLGLISTAIRL